MARFLHEYAGTNWLAWLIIACILAVPFFWDKARKEPVLYHQILNFFLTFTVGSLFGGGDMTGNSAMATVMLLGFGIGYSLLAFRKESESELIWGWAFLLLFGGLAARIVWFQWLRP